MLGLLLLSLPFGLIAAWAGRRWTLALPVGFWLAFSWLEGLGILPGATGLGSALLAGAVGAGFAAIGLVLHPRLRPSAA